MKRKQLHRVQVLSFLCFSCDVTLRSEQEYLNHLRVCCPQYDEEIVCVKEKCSKKEDLTWFVCLICRTSQTSIVAMKSHLDKVHGYVGDEYRTESTLCCQHCNTMFLDLVHFDTHLCGENEKCLLCEEKFSELGSLWSHMFEKHASTDVLMCTQCPTRVLDKKDLSKHMLLSHAVIVRLKSVVMRSTRTIKDTSRVLVDGKEKYVCKECPSTLNSFSSLTRHMMYAHCDETPYACDRCSKAFKTKNKLNIHYNSVHERTRSYDCQFCGRGFAISSNLTKHLRIHTGEKPYVCDECGMDFAQSSSLYSHKITHARNLCFVCSHCSKAFLRPWQLQKHMNSIHLGVTAPRSHVCETCGKGFRTNSEMRRHQETHSLERNYLCEFCNATFAVKKYLTQHYKTHRLT
uniref:Zinc finger protein 675 n=1 Tax=Cacopsylla melanoneura TaxID=428564 RepID=A0A8D8RX71_9HEMI